MTITTEHVVSNLSTIYDYEIIVRTKHVVNRYFVRTSKNADKVAELGGRPRAMSVDNAIDADERFIIIREWPSMESAQAWCDYITTQEGVISAEILED